MEWNENAPSTIDTILRPEIFPMDLLMVLARHPLEILRPAVIQTQRMNVALKSYDPPTNLYI
jgi:hypothetical protein